MSYPLIYVPYKHWKPQFNRMIRPIPRGLLKFLGKRGLKIYILPEEGRNRDIVLNHLKIPEEYLEFSKRAFYWPQQKTIVISCEYFNVKEFNVLIHEIGHAVDFLYLKDMADLRISDLPPVIEILGGIPPLTEHCAARDKETGLKLEQFATGFEAFFNEPEIGKPCIDDLDENMIGLIRSILAEFYGKRTTFDKPGSEREETAREETVGDS